MKLWKRNAVVAAIVLFVCVAVYLNWSYQEEGTETGKVLGQATLVNGATTDPLLAATATPGPEGEPSAVPSDAAKTSTGYFASARLNRQQARDSALTMLQNTLSAGDTEAAMLDAGAAIETLASTTVSEAQIENLVVAKGYTDCVAFIGDDDLSLAVSAPEGGLTEADTAKILDVVKQTAGFTADQIHIIEVE